jgi:uncharacterized membrane protein
MAIARRQTGTVPVREETKTRKIDLQDLRIALNQGWDDFLSKRGDLVFVGLIYPTGVFLGILYAFHMSIVPLMFPLLAGSILLGPAAATGFYELARRREKGMDARWRHFLDVVRGPAMPALVALTTLTAFLFMLWIAAAWIIYSLTVAPMAPHNVGQFLRLVFTTPEGWMMIILGNLVGLGFAVLTLAISAVSFPMIVDKHADAEVAMRASIKVAKENPFTVLAWGLVVVGMLTLGALPLFVGLAVAFPVLGYATWHLYTRAVVR